MNFKFMDVLTEDREWMQPEMLFLMEYGRMVKDYYRIKHFLYTVCLYVCFTCTF